MVAIEGSVDPDGVCCLSIPNRLLGDWANNRIENTSFVALANEYIVDEAITLNPEAARLEDLLYRKSLGVVSKVRKKPMHSLKAYKKKCMPDLKDALSEAQDSQNNQRGKKIDAVSYRHAGRKIQEVSEHANKALEFLSTYGLVAESLKVHTTSGKTFHVPLSDDAASENEDTVDLRVLYILDRYGVNDTFYHELAMLFSELPRSHAVKKLVRISTARCN